MAISRMDRYCPSTDEVDRYYSNNGTAHSRTRSRSHRSRSHRSGSHGNIRLKVREGHYRGSSGSRLYQRSNDYSIRIQDYYTYEKVTFRLL